MGKSSSGVAGAAGAARIVHASDAEVADERVAMAVDAAMGAGSFVGVDDAVSARDGSYSPFQTLFGEGYVGRPRRDEFPTGRPTGDRRLTETARRRATRVLRHIYQDQFERLMTLEAAWLEKHGGGSDGT
jgi:hypothetical protein